MTDETTQALLPVTAEDRELYLALRVFHTCTDKAVLEWGWADNSAEMQAISRHRLAHSLPSQADAGDDIDQSKMSVEMAELFGLVCKLERLKTQRDDLMRTDGGFTAIERAADMMDEIVDSVPELQAAFAKVHAREAIYRAALTPTSGEALNQLQAMGQDFDKDWCINMARKEAGYEIGAGVLAMDPFTPTPPTSGEEMRLREALRVARQTIQIERDHLVSCCSVNGDRNTLDDDAKPDVERMEAVLATIDIALNEGEGE